MKRNEEVIGKDGKGRIQEIGRKSGECGATEAKGGKNSRGKEWEWLTLLKQVKRRW